MSRANGTVLIWAFAVVLVVAACRSPSPAPVGSLTPDPFPGLITLGDARAAEKSRAAAEAAYRQAAAVSPQDSTPYLHLACCWRVRF